VPDWNCEVRAVEVPKHGNVHSDRFSFCIGPKGDSRPFFSLSLFFFPAFPRFAQAIIEFRPSLSWAVLIFYTPHCSQWKSTNRHSAFGQGGRWHIHV